MKRNLKSLKRFTSSKFMVAYLFLVIVFLGAFMLCLPWASKGRNWTSFVDSLFTCVSAISTTGLATLHIGNYFSVFGKIIIVIIIQFGGMGFVTILSMIFYSSKKKLSYEGRLAFQAVASKEDNRDLLKYVRNIVLVTLLIEFIGVICLAPSLIKAYSSFWTGLGYAVFLSISAFCNAGFDPFDNGTMGSLSLFAKNVLVILPVMFLIILGGISFAVIFDIFRKKDKKNKRLTLNTVITLVLTFILIFGAGILYAIFEWTNPNTIGNMSFGNKILNSFFMSVTPRSAGFYTFDIAGLTQQSIFLTEVLMIIGGASVSCAGGIRITTFFLLLVLIFKNCNNNNDVILFKKRISGKLIFKCLKIFMIYLMLIFVSSLLVLLCQSGVGSFSQIIFECISALCTTGLSLDFTGYLTVLSKLIMIILMLIGRIGAVIIALIYVKKKHEVDIEYQNLNIYVG